MKKRTRTSPDAPVSGSGSLSVGSWFPFVLGALVALTIFLSGEQNERLGVAHLPAILWLAAAAYWTLAPVFSRAPSTPIRFSRLDACVYAFFVLVAASILWNLLPGRGGAPRPSLNMLSVWILLAAAWFLFRQTPHDRRTVFALLALVSAVVAAEALTGLYQQFVDIPAMVRQFEADPEGTIRLADPTLQPGSPDWQRMAVRLKSSTPMGTYPMSNTLGGLLACGLVLLVGLRLLEPRPISRPRNIFWGLLLLVVSASLLFTKCRSGYVAAAVGIALLAAWTFFRRMEKPNWRRWTVLSGIAAVSIVAVAVTTSGKSVVSGAKKSLGFRFEYWTASAGMIRDYPVFGCGSGNFKQTYMKYKLPESSEEISDPHNFAVEIAAVSGIPALLLFFVPLGVLLCRSVRPGTSTKEETNSSENPSRLFWGGLFGCWFAFVLSYLSGAPMDFSAPVAATLAFPAVARLLRISSPEGHVSVVPVSVAFIALLVHLLAAGGISVTSTAILLWLFPAILAPRAGTCGPGFYGFRTRIVLATILILALVAVRHFGLRPVSAALSFSLQEETERDLLRKIGLLRRAADADPWSSILRERLASETFRCWMADPSSGAWKNETLSAQRDALRLMPRSATYRFVFAERLNLMARRTGDTALREKAEELYRGAIERYPNNALFRSSFALFLRDAGRRDEAIRQRDAALSLDDSVPHADRKLPPERREALIRFEN